MNITTINSKCVNLTHTDIYLYDFNSVLGPQNNTLLLNKTGINVASINNCNLNASLTSKISEL